MALWTPSDITTDLWLDANDATTITESSGSVSQWDDKSGNAYHFTQSTGANQPTTNSRTLDTKNVIDFDGTNDFMELSSGFQMDSNAMLFIVADVDNDSNKRFLNCQVGTGTRFAMYTTGTTIQYQHNSTFGATSGGTLGTGATMINGYRNGTATGAGQNATYNIASNGGDVNTLDAWYLGCYNGASEFADGGIAEVVLVKSYDLTNRQLIEGYLAHKWGLEGDLPAGHPYKSAAPTTGTEITHTAGVVTLNSNSHTITTTASVDIEHTAGVVTLNSNTHTVFGADAIEITHTTGTVNLDSNSHTITIGDNIEISHTSGIVNLDSNTHTIFVTDPIEITHTAGVVNLDSNTHAVFASDLIEITHVAGVVNLDSNSHTIGTAGTVVIEHTTGIVNLDSNTHTVLGIDPVIITHIAGVINGDSTSSRVGVLADRFVNDMKFSILFGGDNDTRVFMCGKDNKVIYSELADGLPTAEYFPESNSILVSSDNFDVTGLTKQYDRLIIHKENEAHYATYLNDATLGTIFSVFPLNDTVGNRAFGETRLILNNPFVVHDGVYQYSGTNVRDERNAILMSERVQLGLDTLDLTNAITFDFEKNFEYFIAVGTTVYVYNYKVDVWYKYTLTDTPTSFIEIDGVAYFGTSTGQIMKFDANKATDNDTIFTAEWETGFLNFGANWIRKFLTYGWITIKPEVRSSVSIDWETDQGASPISYDLDYNNFSYSNVDYSDWTYSTNFSPRPFRSKFKAKKFSVLKMKGKNESNTDKMTILSITLPAVTGGQVK